MTTVIVTGASGVIGQALVRRIQRQFGPDCKVFALAAPHRRAIPAALHRPYPESTSDAGSSGVSGDLSLSTGTASVGTSGDVSIGSGSSAAGSGGNVAISVAARVVDASGLG